ncbi:hypothetical protein VB715_10110 [Crocosphaera sp. UHCC 0190]|uniref:hypothetical protein n=1 Tax=Crocosphaera sp. UHCC 0190 TaxID=3110246 RepID=UPI002B21DCB7|nr:hypothetical protein [Crocosphaera sp. UHCC 0190]MEA5510115.1 hypothetical protein [Crocosphaera sp. UHCC 0190]
MMSITAWAGLSVNEFFSAYNWTGQPPRLQPLDTSKNNIKPSSFLCLSLGDFLSQGNWTGKISHQPLVKAMPRTQQALMTLPVAEFFQEMGWQGFSKIAPIAQSSSLKKEINSSSQDLNVNNLSDLF